ncbi:hypothetical protein O3P69_017426 [Scylla paramamosain]|uniref:Protein kinase domain-containing protein n=1 Tax=Scylla paramamosain TaxID=85552 RepID=A0AAW0TVQ5_SCYPA
MQQVRNSQSTSRTAGRGQFAVVYHCRHRITGEEFAAKFSSRWRLGADCTSDILHEVGVCALLRQAQRTVQLKEVFRTETELVLVMEYAAGGDLQTLLDEDLVPYERDVISFTRQLLEGLVKVHDLNLVHLDIKPQNLVLMGEFPDCDVKLCDFEISRFLTPGREVREILGTPDYVAPEILLYEPITKKTDMWSLGVLVYVLLTGFLPFGGDTDQETFRQISRGELDFPEELFEDISAEAIDFIKKLLVMQPERRMSAKECQNHEWMKKEVSRPVPSDVVPPKPAAPPLSAPAAPAPTTPASTTSTPTTSVPTTSSVVIPTPIPCMLPTATPTTPATNIPTPPKPVCTTPIPIPLPPAPATPASFAPSAFTPVTAAPFTPATPAAFTPATPASFTPSEPNTPALPELSTPTVDIGRPPLHPLTPVKQFGPVFPEPGSSCLSSPVTAVPHSFLQRSESRSLSRHNLDRIRSMSKSREVLSERIQMSNLKKTISKSRERLFDARLGLSTSREKLMGLRSFSQSVEALSALSHLNQENAVYKSCINIFGPMITPTTKEVDECRMYKSLAAIDQIDEFDCGHKPGYFESRLSKDDEDYNDIVTMHNTNLNSVITVQDTSKPGSGSYMVNEARRRGGRGADICDKRCPRHNHRQPEAQPTQRIPKVNRAEKMKKEAQRRRKEKKEREREEKEKQRALSVTDADVITRNNKATQEKPGDSTTSPGGRRRSMSHVEQRLAERHERQQERLERQERRNSLSHRRPDPVDPDKSPVTERQRSGKGVGSLAVPHERPRSSTPTRKTRSKKPSSGGSDVSQASSLESVDGSLESPRAPPRPQRPTSLDLPEIKIFPDEVAPVCLSGDVNDNILKEDPRGEIDEAYVSLEEPVPCIRSQITPTVCISEPSTTTTPTTAITTTTTSSSCSSSLPHATRPERPVRKFTELLDNPLFVRQAEISNKNCVQNHPDGEPTEPNSADQEKEKIPQVVFERTPIGSVELSIIEEEDAQSLKKPASSFFRSISTSSDVGSMVSESSEYSLDREESGARSPGIDTDLTVEWKSRSRATSFHNSPIPPKPRIRSRSNSFNLESPVNPARPWGTLCDGAVARAMEKFNMKPEEQPHPPATTEKSRRQSSPVMSPSAGDVPTMR